MNKKKSSFGQGFFRLVSLFFSGFNIISHFVRVLKRQLRNAVKNVITLTILGFIAFILLFSLWICILGMLLVWMTTKLSLIISLLIVTLINGLLLLLVVMFILIIKHKLSAITSEIKQLTKI